MKQLPLFFLTDVSHGGFVSYTAHLARSLKAAGVDARVYRRGKGGTFRKWSHGVMSATVPLEQMVGALRTAGAGVIVCGYWKSHAGELEALLSEGAAMVLHDPTEMSEPMMECIERHQTQVVVIRRSNVDNVTQRGVTNVNLVLHPYVGEAAQHQGKRPRRAVTIGRIDFDKNQEIVAGAFDALPVRVRMSCAMFGALNGICGHHHLDQVCPSWRGYWKGTFPKTSTAPVRIAETADYVVDMSAISGDGGGTQYTFFEAWEAGAVLVVNSEWIRDGDEMKPGINCLSADGSGELAGIIARKRDAAEWLALNRGAGETMQQHAPRLIAPQFLKALT